MIGPIGKSVLKSVTFFTFPLQNLSKERNAFIFKLVDEFVLILGVLAGNLGMSSYHLSAYP